MADIESLLNRWQTAGVLDTAAATRIRAFEEEQAKPGGLRWQGMVALILGAILLGCGVVLFVSAHWDELGPAARFAIVIAMVAIFHLAGGYRQRFTPWELSQPERQLRWWVRFSTSRSTGLPQC